MFTRQVSNFGGARKKYYESRTTDAHTTSRRPAASAHMPRWVAFGDRGSGLMQAGWSEREGGRLARDATSDRVTLRGNTRAYLTMPPVGRGKNAGTVRFDRLNLLADTLRVEVDLSNVGCGCNSAIYLVAAAEHAVYDAGDSDYCDITTAAPCLEADLFEGNLKAARATLHTQAGIGADGSCNAWGCAHGLTGASYGRTSGSAGIDTRHAFEVAARFDTDGRMHVQLSQAHHGVVGAPVVSQQTLWDVSLAGNTQPPVAARDTHRVRGAFLQSEGLVLAVSLWAAAGNGMAWLDGGCNAVYPHCQLDRASVTLSNLRFDSTITPPLPPSPRPPPSPLPPPSGPPLQPPPWGASASPSPPLPLLVAPAPQPRQPSRMPSPPPHRAALAGASQPPGAPRRHDALRVAATAGAIMVLLCCMLWRCFRRRGPVATREPPPSTADRLSTALSRVTGLMPASRCGHPRTRVRLGEVGEGDQSWAASRATSYVTASVSCVDVPGSAQQFAAMTELNDAARQAADTAMLTAPDVGVSAEDSESLPQPSPRPAAQDQGCAEAEDQPKSADHDKTASRGASHYALGGDLD